MAQVNIYVSRTDHERIGQYAADLGLDVTALSNLLLTRELRVGRLGGLLNRPTINGRRDAKVTAHLSKERRAAFAARADGLGLSVSQAGAILVLSELEERWLEKSVDK